MNLDAVLRWRRGVIEPTGVVRAPVGVAIRVFRDVGGLSRHLLLLAGCGDAVAPSSVPDRTPHFLRWAPVGSAVRRLGTAGRPDRGRASLSLAAAPVADGFGTSWAGTTSRLTWLHPVGRGQRIGCWWWGCRSRTPATGDRGQLRRSAPDPSRCERNDDGSARVELWYLTAPASGGRPISVSLSGTADVVAGAMAFSGVDQALPARRFRRQRFDRVRARPIPRSS